jgi:hypothetical protein
VIASGEEQKIGARVEKSKERKAKVRISVVSTGRALASHHAKRNCLYRFLPSKKVMENSDQHQSRNWLVIVLNLLFRLIDRYPRRKRPRLLCLQRELSLSEKRPNSEKKMLKAAKLPLQSPEQLAQSRRLENGWLSHEPIVCRWCCLSNPHTFAAIGR